MKDFAGPNFHRIQPHFCVNAKLRKLHRLLNGVYQRQFQPFGLRGSMLSILFIIGKQPGVNQKTLAEHLVLDTSTISRDLKRLMEKGWVHTSPGEDARNRELSLTQKGYDLLEEVSPIWESLQHQVEQILGTFQLQQIDHVIEAIQANVNSFSS